MFLLTRRDEEWNGGGSGRSLPNGFLIASTVCALFATFFSFYSINQHLRSYRKPVLQRYVVRLLVMVPIYSLSSLASLFSLEAAFIIDLVRDIYEAFVILSFFSLLVEYLGGERSLLIVVHGRKPTPHVFPVNLFFSPLDISDPYTFLGLKRGILQYVQIKPILAVITVVLKSIGKYDDGKLAWNNGYTWVSITYNFSVFLSLYCLGMFWAGLSEDLAPFRVTSKFLCIKGIIFFSFWQGLGVSILVAAGWILQIGPVRDEQYISLAVQDMLICLEMPLFALAHQYAFSPKDYIDPFSSYQSRLPAYYAIRDAIGMFDVISDSLMTIRGTGYGYQTFEPSEGVIHQGLGRQRRSRAGLRYSKGGKQKYWLPQRVAVDMSRDGDAGARHQGPGKSFRRWLDRKRMEREGYAPLLRTEAQEVVHEDPDLEAAEEEDDSTFGPLGQMIANVNKDSLKKPGTLAGQAGNWATDQAQSGLEYFNAGDSGEIDSEEEAKDVSFSDVDESGEDEKLYQSSRELKHGDYAFPNVDIRQEEARKQQWKDDEDMLRRHKQRQGQKAKLGRASKRQDRKSDPIPNARSEGVAEEGADSSSPPKPTGVVDLLVEDSKAEERERVRERRRGDPALRAGQRTRIFRREWESGAKSNNNGYTSMEPEERPPKASASSSPRKRPTGSHPEVETDTRYHRDYHATVTERVESDAYKEQHPKAPSAQEEPEDTHVDPSAKVESVEVGEADRIAHAVHAPAETKVKADR